MFPNKKFPIKILVSLGLVFILLGVIYQPALADGIVIPDPPPISEPIRFEEIFC